MRALLVAIAVSLAGCQSAPAFAPAGNVCGPDQRLDPWGHCRNTAPRPMAFCIIPS